jgi:galactitol-specific phosphotransferase system IIB component
MTKEKSNKSKRLGLSLTGITPEFKIEYDNLAKANNMTHTEFAKLLLDSYKYFNVEIEEKDKDIINQALQIAPNTYKHKIKKVVLRYAANIVESNNLDSNIDENKINSSKSADMRADIILNIIFTHNETATNNYDKIFITKSSFSDFAKKLKNDGKTKFTTSKAVINRCLERRRALIEDHHSKQGLDDGHNLKSYYTRLKANNSIDSNDG